MESAFLASGEGTLLRLLSEDKQKGLVEVVGKSILTYCFEQFVDFGAKKLKIISQYGDEFESVLIKYAHHREQNGLTHPFLDAEENVDDYILMLNDIISQANLEAIVNCQQEDRADSAFFVGEVPSEEPSRYGVCDTNDYGENQEVVEQPPDPPSNLVMIGFYTFTPAISNACELIQPSDRGEYEILDAIDLLIKCGRSIEAILMIGWRIDVGYPVNLDGAENQHQEN